MKTPVIVIAVVLGFVMSSCGLLSKKYTKSAKEIHAVSSDGKTKLVLNNINGNVNIKHSDDSGFVKIKAEKEIKVKKKYLDTPFDEITLEIDTIGSEINIEAIIGKRGEDDGFNLNFNRRQKVDYEIFVPPGISVVIENVNGNVTAENISNDLVIHQINGDVEIDNYSGELECEITNGSFSGNIDSTKGITINIINGKVSLGLSNYINAKVSAQSLNSKITTENLSFTVMDQEKKSFRGSLGSGDEKSIISIETVNGKIYLYGEEEI